MKECLDDDRLMRVVDGDDAIAGGHLEECGACRAKVERLRLTEHLLRDAAPALKPVADPFPTQSHPKRFLWLGPAAALFMFACVLVWIVQEPSQKNPAKPDPQESGTDAHGDPLPPGAIARMGTVRYRHASDVTRAVFSPDGKTVASTGGDDTVRLWEANTGKELLKLRSNKSSISRSVAFSPNGRMLASGGDSAVCLWEVATGKEVLALPVDDSVISVAFSPNGETLAAGQGSTVRGIHRIRLWEVATGKEVLKIDEEGSSVVFSPDGRTLASAGKGIRLWDVSTGHEILRFGDETVRALAFSPDGTRIVSGGQDKIVHLWESATGREQFRLEGHEDWIFSVAFSPDGKTLASGSHDKTIRLWDTATRAERTRLQGHQGDVFSVAFSPDGKRLASSGRENRIRLWDVATAQEIFGSAGHDGKVGPVIFSPDGKTLASRSNDETLRLWDVATGKELHQFGHKGYKIHAFRGLTTAAFSAGGKALLSMEGKHVRLWDTATGKELWQLERNEQTDVFIFSSDGRMLATNEAGTLCIYETATGKELLRREGSPLALSPDGQWLALSNKGMYGIIESATGKQRVALQRPQECKPYGESFAFSPDGGTLISWDAHISNQSMDDPHVHVWEVATGRELASLPGANWVAFSPDSKVLAGAGWDGDIFLAEPATGKILAAKLERQLGGRYVVFSPDGKMLTSATEADSSVILWETATGSELFKWDGATAPAFSPEGGSIAMAMPGGTIIVWSLPLLGGKGPANLAGLWADLGDGDGRKAYRAIGSLSAMPQKAVPFLKDHMGAPSLDPGRVRRLLADLDHDDPAVREKASEALRGLDIEPELRKMLEGSPSTEVRSRVEALLEELERPVVGANPEACRRGRVIQTLEWIGTKEARTALKDLAKDAPWAGVRREARAALDRLSARPPK